MEEKVVRNLDFTGLKGKVDVPDLITDLKDGNRVATNEQNIATLQGDVSSQGSAIANLEDEVSTKASVQYVDNKFNGAAKAIAYDSYSTMITAFNALDADVYAIGQDVLIQTLQVPDLWVSGIESSSVPYTYVDDATFTNELNTNGYVQVGYYKLSALETEKANITNMMTTDTDQDISAGKTYVGNKCTNLRQTSNSPSTRDLLRLRKSNESPIVTMKYDTANHILYIGKNTSNNYVKLTVKQNETNEIALKADIKKLYRHQIKIYGDATAIITTDDATPFTAATLAQWLYDNGFRRSSTYQTYPLKLAITASNNSLSIPLSIYNNTNNSNSFVAEVKNITFTTDGTNVSVSATSQGYSQSSITDNVTEI